MKTYTVHVSDPSGFDDSVEVEANEDGELGAALHLALDELLARHRAPLMFPIFVDVHPARAYSQNSWMFKGAGRNSSN